MIPRMIEFMKTHGNREWKLHHFVLYDFLVTLMFLGPLAAGVLLVLIFISDIRLDWRYCAAIAMASIAAIATVQYIDT